MTTPSRSRSLHRSPGTRRAFSMLEVMLALVVGMLVLLGCLSLLGVMRRGESVASTRFEASLMTERTHRTVANALGQLLMAGSYRVDETDAVNADEDDKRAADAAAGDADSRDALAGEDPEDLANDAWRDATGGPGGGPVRLRLMEVDDVPTMYSTTENAEVSAQRLQVTTIAPPIFSPPGGARLQPAGWTDAARDQTAPAMRISEGQGYSGVFDPVPTEQPGVWELWYRPIRPGGDPVLLMRDLTLVRFSAFKADPERRGSGRYINELDASFAEDLPGFITLEVETNTGEWHNWMFEVRWLTQPMTGSGAFDVDTDGDGIPDSPAIPGVDEPTAPGEPGDKPGTDPLTPPIPDRPGPGTKPTAPGGNKPPTRYTSPGSRFGGLKGGGGNQRQ